MSTCQAYSEICADNRNEMLQGKGRKIFPYRGHKNLASHPERVPTSDLDEGQ
jgi:hypothetical protein